MIEECTWGARFQESYVLINECTWGFQEKVQALPVFGICPGTSLQMLSLEASQPGPRLALLWAKVEVGAEKESHPHKHTAGLVP